MTDPAVLRRALADDPEGLARALARVPAPRVQTVQGERGNVVAIDGRKLHSARDPEAEARRFVRELDLAEATVVILLGYGSGYVARAIAARSRATIYAFEPDLDQLVVGLGHGVVPPSVRVLTTPSRMGEVLYARLASSDRGVVVKWTPSLRLAPAVYEAGLQTAMQAIDRAALRHRTARMRGPGWLRHYLENLPAIAREPGLPALADGLRGVPAIVVAAGPSLDRNVEQLRTLRQHALVLAVNTAASALARAGVVPHAVVAIESLDVSTQLAALPFLREVPAFLELTGHPGLWQLPFAQTLPISVDTNACAHFSARIDPKHHLAAGFCVANAAVAIAHALGCGPIVLVGSDLAYSGERVYASGTAFADMRASVGADGVAQLSGMDGKRAIEQGSGDAGGGSRMPDRARTMPAPGWHPDTTVHTTRDFLMFRDWYTAAAKTLRERGIRPVNATEGGMQIPGWDHVPLADAVPTQQLAPGELDARWHALRQRPASKRETVLGLVAGERRSADELLSLAREATATMGDDPDGDLTLTPETKARLFAINARARKLLRRAPLVAEAVAPAIEDLRMRGHMTGFGFYAALVEPLQEIDAALARLSQRLQASDGEPSQAPTPASAA